MKTLYIDCSMGCAGDMLTAALLELHPDPAAFLAGMNAALGGRAVVSAAPDAKCGIRGTHVTVRIHGQQEGAHPLHTECAHGGASAAEIMAFLDTAPLSRPVRENAKAVYGAPSGSRERGARLHGRAGAFSRGRRARRVGRCAVRVRAHGRAAAARVLCSPINVGQRSGPLCARRAACACPGDGAAAARRAGLCRQRDGRAVHAHGRGCCCGSSCLTTVRCRRCASPPPGYGTGTKDFAAANVVRVLLGENGHGDEQVVELCCNIDDQPAESLAFAMDALLALGALDVYFTAAGMKKSRPGVVLTCLAVRSSGMPCCAASFAIRRRSACVSAAAPLQPC